VAPLRERIDASFAGADAAEDRQADVSEAVRADYREWRTQRVDPLVTTAITRALNGGVLAAVDPAVPLRWLSLDADEACEMCRANGDGPGSASHEVFPSGHLAPPIHEGCRCVLVVEQE